MQDLYVFASEKLCTQKSLDLLCLLLTPERNWVLKQSVDCRYRCLYTLCVYMLLTGTAACTHSCTHCVFICCLQVPLPVHILAHIVCLYVAYNSFSVVTATTRYGPGFKLAWGERYFLFSMLVQSGPGPTQPPVRWVLLIVSRGKVVGALRWQPAPM